MSKASKRSNTSEEDVGPKSSAGRKYRPFTVQEDQYIHDYLYSIADRVHLCKHLGRPRTSMVQHLKGFLAGGLQKYSDAPNGDPIPSDGNTEAKAGNKRKRTEPEPHSASSIKDEAEPDVKDQADPDSSTSS
ncbi:hypothetical protein ACQY0O_004422 [Thecaphora frezii]